MDKVLFFQSPIFLWFLLFCWKCRHSMLAFDISFINIEKLQKFISQVNTLWATLNLLVKESNLSPYRGNKLCHFLHIFKFSHITLFAKTSNSFLMLAKGSIYDWGSCQQFDALPYYLQQNTESSSSNLEKLLWCTITFHFEKLLLYKVNEIYY